MRKPLVFFLACLLCLGGCVCSHGPLDKVGPLRNGGNESARAERTGSGDGQTPDSPRQQAVLNRMNKERRANGLGNLFWDTELARMAEQRAREISDTFSHTRPDGSGWMTLLDGYSRPWTSCGENIALGQSDPQAVMDAWMLSSGHRANILKDAFTRLGVGIYEAPDGKMYWVQIFAGQ